jgi:secreted PhoX family phosphatase
VSSKLHPDSRLQPSQHISNPAGNRSIFDVMEERELNRRGFLKTSFTAAAGAAAMTVLGTGLADASAASVPAAPPPAGGIGFASVPPNLYLNPGDDAVTVPDGYTARVLVAWGDSLTPDPHWDASGAMDEATQLHCYGSHTDGMHFFPHRAEDGGPSSSRGVLVSNSEYVDPGLVNNTVSYATDALSLEMVRTQQAAHGINVLKIHRIANGQWRVNRRSPLNRRITANTPCALGGPAAGHRLLQTAADPAGRVVLGTLNNCAHGHTPWGTYLSCEENWHQYFSNGTAEQAGIVDPHLDRYGVVNGGSGFRWHEVDERFRADLHPNEPNRFGWVVEINPDLPNSVPVKRTAMGRFKHEGAQVLVDKNDRVAFYMGDDERNEYIYKFVCARPPRHRGAAENAGMLDHGTLYVAKFHADGTGQWLALVWGENGLTPENGFADQGEVLIKTRLAADRLGATMMDRPEWGAAHPVTGEIYMTLTNNNRRGNAPVSLNQPDGLTPAASANPPVDAANPRPDNDYGHIIRWREDGGSVTSRSFSWDIFVRCGDKATTKTLAASYTSAGDDGYRGTINGDDYGAPDGLWFDKDGRLWIETDQIGNATGDWANIGGNVLMCADPSSGRTKRFLTSPKNCEVTGLIGTPDGRTLFVGIQHPGESWDDPALSPDPTRFTANSTWPDSGVNGPTTQSGRGTVYKPRSAVVVITKNDGGVIGT